MYDSAMVQPMREEVTRLGVAELRTPAESTRPSRRRAPNPPLRQLRVAAPPQERGRGLTLALMHSRPDHLFTVFAGMESEAVARAREYFQPYQPSSPQIALLKDGKLVHMLQRHDIEGRDPQTIAQSLAKVFDQHCKKG